MSLIVCTTCAVHKKEVEFVRMARAGRSGQCRQCRRRRLRRTPAAIYRTMRTVTRVREMALGADTIDDLDIASIDEVVSDRLRYRSSFSGRSLRSCFLSNSPAPIPLLVRRDIFMALSLVDNCELIAREEYAAWRQSKIDKLPPLLRHSINDRNFTSSIRRLTANP